MNQAKPGQQQLEVRDGRRDYPGGDHQRRGAERRHDLVGR